VPSKLQVAQAGGRGSGSRGNAGSLVAVCGDRRRAEGFWLVKIGFDRFNYSGFGDLVGFRLGGATRGVGSGTVRQKLDQAEMVVYFWGLLSEVVE